MEIDTDRVREMGAAFEALATALESVEVDKHADAVSSGMTGSTVGRLVPSQAHCGADALRSLTQRYSAVNPKAKLTADEHDHADGATADHLHQVAGGVW